MQKVISRDRTEIAFDQTGRGPVVILVGGALQHRGDRLFSKLAPALGKHFTVVDYDRRGRGDSRNTLPYAPARELEDLEAIIDSLPGSIYLFGMSSGGALALRAAVANPRIKKVALYEPPFVAPEPRYRDELGQLLAAKKNGEAIRRFLRVVGMPRLLVAALGVTPMWPTLRKLAPTLEYDAELMGDGKIPASFGSLTTPTLILTGSSESMRGAATALAAVLPRAHHEVLEGQTHNVEPGPLANALSGFFEARVASRPAEDRLGSLEPHA